MIQVRLLFHFQIALFRRGNERNKNNNNGDRHFTFAGFSIQTTQETSLNGKLPIEARNFFISGFKKWRTRAGAKF